MGGGVGVRISRGGRCGHLVQTVVLIIIISYLLAVPSFPFVLLTAGGAPSTISAAGTKRLWQPRQGRDGVTCCCCAVL